MVMYIKFVLLDELNYLKDILEVSYISFNSSTTDKQVQKVYFIISTIHGSL